MKIIMVVTAPKTEIKKAIAKGWKDRTGNELALKAVEYPGDPEDLAWAMPHLVFLDAIKVTEVAD